MYEFLACVEAEFDAEKRDMLKNDLKPTPEEAYAVIRIERGRRLVMGSEPQLGGPSSTITLGIGARLTVKPPDGQPMAANGLAREVEQGFTTKPRSDFGRGLVVVSSLRGNSSGGDRSKLKYSHC